MSDIVVTWPKSRAFASYLAELELAKARSLVVSFRLPTLPSPTPERCYRVHDGEVRGYLKVLHVARRMSNEITRVASDPKAKAETYWPAGVYITCDPHWHPVNVRLKMQGFRGWRWFKREAADTLLTRAEYEGLGFRFTPEAAATLDKINAEDDAWAKWGDHALSLAWMFGDHDA